MYSTFRRIKNTINWKIIFRDLSVDVNWKLCKFLSLWIYKLAEHFNPIHDGVGGWCGKRPSTSFSPVTSTNVGINPQSFQTFSFQTYLVPVKLLNPEHLSKNCFFWSKPCKIKVMTTSVIEMLELPNFGFWSHAYIYNIIWVIW